MLMMSSCASNIATASSVFIRSIGWKSAAFMRHRLALSICWWLCSAAIDLPTPSAAPIRTCSVAARLRWAYLRRCSSVPRMPRMPTSPRHVFDADIAWAALPFVKYPASPRLCLSRGVQLWMHSGSAVALILVLTPVRHTGWSSYLLLFLWILQEVGWEHNMSVHSSPRSPEGPAGGPVTGCGPQGSPGSWPCAAGPSNICECSICHGTHRSSHLPPVAVPLVCVHCLFETFFPAATQPHCTVLL